LQRGKFKTRRIKIIRKDTKGLGTLLKPEIGSITPLKTMGKRRFTSKKFDQQRRKTAKRKGTNSTSRSEEREA